MDVGQVALADRYRRRALLRAGDGFIEVGVSPKDSEEWLQYERILDKRSSDLSGRVSRAEIEALWSEIEPIAEKRLDPKFISHTGTAKDFAVNGNIDRARELLVRAREIGERESVPTFALDKRCAKAQVDVLARDWTEVEVSTQSCVGGFEARGLTVGSVIPRLRAEALEAQGRLGEARAAFEDDVVVRSLPSLRFALTPGSDRRATREELFAVADPVYAKSCVSVYVARDALASTRSAAGLDDGALFAPLPETRREIAAIASLFGGEGVASLVGTDALESRVESAPLDRDRYLHFATHGIIGHEVPGITEPALVLGGEPGEDGLLLASEAIELELDADLAVLSACKTGSGEYVQGEGTMGMSRAFLAAGSRAVLVSLWAVDSLATEALMVRFYRELRGGKGPGEAIRDAKRALIADWEAQRAGESRGLRIGVPQARSAKTLDPSFWSAFVLIGGS